MVYKKIISLFLINFFLFFSGHANAAVMTNSDFTQAYVPQLINRMCFDEQSPFKTVYKGEPKNCGLDVSKIYGKSCERYVPKKFNINSQFQLVYTMTIKCLAAHYLGGAQQSAFENKINGGPLKKKVFLKRLKPSLVKYLCDPNETFRKNGFKGGQKECEDFTAQQFDTCAYNLDYVKIPDIIENKQQGNKYGSILGECVSAHYIGGDLLNAFKMFQGMENKK